jgi:anti-sigma B factor antagonist
VSPEHSAVLWVGQAAVVALPAEIDITNADQLREDLLAVVNRGAAMLVVDMSATTFCDSAGVNALARTYKRATASGAGMGMVVCAPAVRRVLAITEIDRLIASYPSVAAALDSMLEMQGSDGKSHPEPT